MVKVATDNVENIHSSSRRPSPGIYHVSVVDVEVQADRVNVQFEVCAGRCDNPEQNVEEEVGRQHTEAFFLIGKDEDKQVHCNRRILIAGVALGLITEEQFKAAKESGEEIDVPLEEAAGRQCLVKFASESYTDRNGVERTGSKMDFNLISLTDKNYVKVPRCEKSLALLGLSSPAAGTAPTNYSTGAQAASKPAQSAASASKPAASKPAAKATANSFDDI